MDYLRSCYEAQVRFDPSRPADLRTIRWYFADPAATNFSGPSPFRSRNYSNLVADDGDLGEVVGLPRPWSNGATPSPYPPGSVCGSADMFQNGIVLGGTWPVGANGVKACCVTEANCCDGTAVLGPSVDMLLSSVSCPCLDGVSLAAAWTGSEYDTGFILSASCGPDPGSGCWIRATLSCSPIGPCDRWEAFLAISNIGPFPTTGIATSAVPPDDCTCGPPFEATYHVGAFHRVLLGTPGVCDSCLGATDVVMDVAGT
jgi:hypothetical protein